MEIKDNWKSNEKKDIQLFFAGYVHVEHVAVYCRGLVMLGASILCQNFPSLRSRLLGSLCEDLL